jgi:hypothetical protein
MPSPWGLRIQQITFGGSSMRSPLQSDFKKKIRNKENISLTKTYV